MNDYDQMYFEIDYLLSNCLYDIYKEFEKIENLYYNKIYEKNIDIGINYIPNNINIDRDPRFECRDNVNIKLCELIKNINKDDYELFIFWYIFFIIINMDRPTGISTFTTSSKSVQYYKEFKLLYNSYKKIHPNLIYEMIDNFGSLKYYFYIRLKKKGYFKEIKKCKLKRRKKKSNINTSYIKGFIDMILNGIMLNNIYFLQGNLQLYHNILKQNIIYDE